MNLFHVAFLPLMPGAVIEPGNFGRCIQLHQACSFMAHREAIYELIRAKEFPEKPSRLESIFLLPTAEEAYQYKAEFASLNIVYEVEVLNPYEKQHTTFIDLVCVPKNPAEPVHALCAHARNYWQSSLEPFRIESTHPLAVTESTVASMGTGQPTRSRELVIESPIRIVRRLDA